MKLKTWHKIVGVALVGSMLFAAKKAIDYSHVIERIEVLISKIKNIRGKLINSKWVWLFDMDVTLYNPTDINFNISTAGLVEVKKIEVFFKGEKIGEAISDVTKISLPAQGGFTLTNVTFTIVANTVIAMAFETDIIQDLANYQIHTTIIALGKAYIIEN